MSYCYQDPDYDDYSYEYADNGSYDNGNNKCDTYEPYLEANHSYPEPDHYMEYGDELNRAKPVYDNPDPTQDKHPILWQETHKHLILRQHRG